jgi:hypothetical protein
MMITVNTSSIFRILSLKDFCEQALSVEKFPAARLVREINIPKESPAAQWVDRY